MAGVSGEKTRVITIEAVQACVRALRHRRIHPWFPAYLHLRQQSTRQRTLTEITPNWNALGTLLEVPGGPYGQPYFRPFWNGPAAAGQEWLNPNLAGSYAPSSLRAVPKKVIDVSNRKFVLRERHWELAREHLTDGERVPAAALGGYFLRDFGIVSTRELNPNDLVQLFLHEFGYRLPADQEEVSHLFDVDWIDIEGSWFELLDEDAAT